MPLLWKALAAYLILPSIQPTGTIDTSYCLDNSQPYATYVQHCMTWGSHLRTDIFPAVPAFHGTFDNHILRETGIHLSHGIERQAYTNEADELIQEFSA